MPQTALSGTYPWHAMRINTRRMPRKLSTIFAIRSRWRDYAALPLPCRQFTAKCTLSVSMSMLAMLPLQRGSAAVAQDYDSFDYLRYSSGKIAKSDRMSIISPDTLTEATTGMRGALFLPPPGWRRNACRFGGYENERTARRR